MCAETLLPVGRAFGLRALPACAAWRCAHAPWEEDVRTKSADTPAAASQFAELQSRIVNSLLLTMRVDTPAGRRLQFCLQAPLLMNASSAATCVLSPSKSCAICS